MQIDFAIKRSKVIIGSLVEQIWLILSPQFYILRFIIKDFLISEKKIFKCFFLPYMGITTTLFNGAKPFKQFVSTSAFGISAVWIIFHFLWDHWTYFNIFKNGAAHVYA